jgi:hypothetical protein
MRSAPPGSANPFHEHMPRQALALAGWVLGWMASEHLMRGQGLDGRRQLGLFLAVLALIGAGAGLATRRWLFDLLTSVRFAVTQGVFLCAAALLAMATGPELYGSLGFCALLAVLAASMLAVTWKRRPYDFPRLGFLLVHTAPALVLLGALWGRFDGVRAQAILHAGAAVDTWQRIDDPGRFQPGFRLRLEPAAIVVLDGQDRELARAGLPFQAPLRFRGYRLYQSQDAPDACVIRLVRQPGLWLVQTGCASFLLGCAWMFYLKPLLKRRQARP